MTPIGPTESPNRRVISRGPVTLWPASQALRLINDLVLRWPYERTPVPKALPTAQNAALHDRRMGSSRDPGNGRFLNPRPCRAVSPLLASGATTEPVAGHGLAERHQGATAG